MVRVVRATRVCYWPQGPDTIFATWTGVSEVDLIQDFCYGKSRYDGNVFRGNGK